MKHFVDTRWEGKMIFDADVDGHHLVMDAEPGMGGEDKGPRPKKLMLASLAGCTGMDVVSILKKMRVAFTGLNIRISADVTEEHPKHYERIHIIYEFSGKELNREALEKAVTLSQERYCGVSHVYKKAMEMTWEIVLEETDS